MALVSMYRHLEIELVRSSVLETQENHAKCCLFVLFVVVLFDDGDEDAVFLCVCVCLGVSLFFFCLSNLLVCNQRGV